MPLLPEGSEIAGYQIVRLLGEGGMGAVYEARQKALGRRVALKTLHAEYAANRDMVTRFLNEAKVLSRLEHPSLVQVSDFGCNADGTVYLVMEYLRGQSLGSRLKANPGQMSAHQIMQVGWQVADVLAIAHVQGIVHRDIKPDNLMLVLDPIAPSGERVKVLDFGIAKLIKDPDPTGVKTDSLALLGTPMYMSPEQCSGAGGVDPQTDVYSLGCVLYHLLAGRPPFEGEGPGQLIGKHLFQVPTPLIELVPQAPPKLVSFVEQMLSKDKSQRPTMSEVADRLGELLAELPFDGLPTRSSLPADISASAPDATTVQPTTLGHSLGQQLAGTGAARRYLAAAVIATAVFGGVLFALWGARSSSRPAASNPQQPAVQAPTATVAPRAEVPKQPEPQTEPPRPVAPNPPPPTAATVPPKAAPRPGLRTTPSRLTPHLPKQVHRDPFHPPD